MPVDLGRFAGERGGLLFGRKLHVVVLSPGVAFGAQPLGGQGAQGGLTQ